MDILSAGQHLKQCASSSPGKCNGNRPTLSNYKLRITESLPNFPKQPTNPAPEESSLNREILPKIPGLRRTPPEANLVPVSLILLMLIHLVLRTIKTLLLILQPATTAPRRAGFYESDNQPTARITTSTYQRLRV